MNSIFNFYTDIKLKKNRLQIKRENSFMNKRTLKAASLFIKPTLY